MENQMLDATHPSIIFFFGGGGVEIHALNRLFFSFVKGLLLNVVGGGA